MSEANAPDEGRPDPSLVFNAEDLGIQLDRLRRRHGSAGGRQRTSLDWLSRHTGVPRSTLPPYLTGASLPPAAALDAIVLALGCTPREARDWASALEQVVDRQRGGHSRGAVSPTSRFSTFATLVREQLTRPTDHCYDEVEHLALFEQVWLGPHRNLAAVRQTATIRATASGVDRYAIRMVPDPSVDLDALQLSSTVNCTPGEHRTLPELGVRVMEVLLHQPLAAGETSVLELTVDYAAAVRDATVVCSEHLRGFRRRGPMFTMEVRFAPSDLPSDVRQIHLPHADAKENRVTPLSLNPWSAAHIAVAEPVAGLHGIRWTWD